MAEFKLLNKGSITVDFARGVIASILSGSTELTLGETPIFELRLLEADGTKHELFASDATSVTLTDDGAVYGGFEYDVTVKIWARCDDRLELFIDVDNRTAWAVEWVKFPCVSLKPLSGNGGIGRVVYPYNEGALVDDADLRNGIWNNAFGHKDPEYPSHGSYCMFPYMICSQFEGYISREGDGFYLGAHDTERGPKGVEFYKNGNGGITMCMRLYVGKGRGEGTDCGYPLALDLFKGDWEDCADIYRDWFEANLPEGTVKIKDNTKLPEWYKDSPLIVSYPVRGIHDMDEMYPNALFPYMNAMPLIEEISEKTAARLMVVLMHWEGSAPWAPPYVWPPYGGEECFRQFMDALHARGDLLGVYCSGFGYTIQSNLIAEYNMTEEYERDGLSEAMCASPSGEIGISRICTGQRSGYDICAASDKGRELLIRAYKPLLESGVDYAQILDQNHGGSQYFCYSDKHGHPAIPGKWMTLEMRKLLGEWNEIGGRMLLGCESAAAEAYIPNLLFSDNRYELNFHIGRPIPLYGYIYHEYLRNFMGNQVCCALKHLEDGKTIDTMRFRLAYSYLCGDSMTLVVTPEGKLMANWGNHDFEHVPDKDLTLKFCRNAVRLYKEGAGDYLWNARMIKPLAYECRTVPLKTIHERTVEYPAAMSSAWEKDGRRVQIFLNHTEEACEVTMGDKSFVVPALDGCMVEI